MSDDIANFVGQCGECQSGYYSATDPTGMQPGQSATVNGHPPQDCVVANDGAKVFEIALAKIAGPYEYQVRVEAQGPSGFLSGSMHLAFQDKTGDVYYLDIYSSTKEGHEVSFNSSAPAIVTIYWSDSSFTVNTGDAAKDKPRYKILSPA